MILLYLIILILISLFLLILVKENQKKIKFLHPGWILIGVILMYSSFVPAAYLLGRNNFSDLYFNVYKHFDYKNFTLIMSMYIFSLLGFLYAQFIIMFLNKKRINSLSRKNKYNKFIVHKKGIFKFVTLLLLVIGIYIIYFRFSSIGGFLTYMNINRRDLAAKISRSLSFARYDIFINIYFILIFNYLLSNKINLFKKIFVNILLLNYFIFLLLMGVRLNILVLLIGLFFLIYSNNINSYIKGDTKIYFSKFWLKNKKKILIIVILIFLFMSWYTFQRANIRDGFTNDSVKVNKVSILSIVFPEEFITAYSPGLIILENNWGNLGPTYWKKFIPNTLMELLGFSRNTTVSSDLTTNIHGTTSRAAVYTITLPLDIFVGTNSFFMIFIISSIIYLVSYFLIYIFYRKNFWGRSISALLYLNLFYIIRVEAANWFSRIWQSFLVLIIIYFFYFILSKLKWRN